MNLINQLKENKNMDFQEFCFGDERKKQGISDRNIFSLENSKKTNKMQKIDEDSIAEFYKNSTIETPKHYGSDTFRKKSEKKDERKKIKLNSSQRRIKEKKPGLLTKLQKKQEMIMNSGYDGELSSKKETRRKFENNPEVQSFKDYSSENDDKSLQSISNIKESVDFILSNPSE